MIPPSRNEASFRLDIAHRDASRWFLLAVMTLGIAGALAVVLLVGRIPQLAPAVIQSPEFARRALVVHVNHAVAVWFFAFIAGLASLMPGARPVRMAPIAVSIATIGVAAFTLSTFGSATPLLSNYIPSLDDGVFLSGLALFALGVTSSFVDRRLLPETWRPRHRASPSLDEANPSDAVFPRAARGTLRCAALAYVCAMLTIGGAFVTQEADMDRLDYFERLFWGGGHLLQIACVLGMLAVWLFLFSTLTGKSAISARLTGVLSAALVVPALLGPWLTFTRAPSGVFTSMMQWGIFPPVSAFIAFGGASLIRHRRSIAPGALASPAFVGLVTSAAMTVGGFLLGAMITQNTTLVPAHYHLSIGAVTVSFMAVLFVLMPRLGWPVRWPRLATWQPLAYGAGQTVFAGGLAVAGFWGQAARKVYGSQQDVRGSSELLGLAVAGVGGVTALVAGVAFVWIVIGGVVSRRHA